MSALEIAPTDRRNGSRVRVGGVLWIWSHRTLAWYSLAPGVYGAATVAIGTIRPWCWFVVADTCDPESNPIHEGGVDDELVALEAAAATLFAIMDTPDESGHET